MTALLTITGCVLCGAGITASPPWTALAYPGALLLLLAMQRHHNPARAARRRANRRKGYLR